MLITLFNAPNGKLRMTELGERVVLSASGVSHLVTRLERDGLVRRTADPKDRRSFFAELTRAGHRRLHDSRPTHNAVVRAHLTDRVTPAQLSRLGDLWEAILGSCTARGVEPDGDAVTASRRPGFSIGSGRAPDGRDAIGRVDGTKTRDHCSGVVRSEPPTNSSPPTRVSPRTAQGSGR